jgi:microcystin-dependent protein
MLNKISALAIFTLASTPLPSFAAGCAASISNGMSGAEKAEKFLQCLVELENENGRLKERLETAMSNNFPPGAVLASRRKCPEGWSDVKELAGRVVLGEGAGFGKNGEPLTPRVAGTSEGNERIKLTVGNLPSHNHRISTGTNPIGWRDDLAGGEIKGGIDSTFMDTDPNIRRDGGQGILPSVLENTGNGDAIEIMPPFYVLAYCEKAPSN